MPICYSLVIPTWYPLFSFTWNSIQGDGRCWVFPKNWVSYRDHLPLDIFGGWNLWTSPKNDHFLAIHWKYNHGDWLRHCEHHSSPACTTVLEYKLNFVKTISKSTRYWSTTTKFSEEIAEQIALYLRKWPQFKALWPSTVNRSDQETPEGIFKR